MSDINTDANTDLTMAHESFAADLAAEFEADQGAELDVDAQATEAEEIEVDATEEVVDDVETDADEVEADEAEQEGDEGDDDVRALLDGIDPNELPEEVRGVVQRVAEHLERREKELTGDYTRKTQGIAEVKSVTDHPVAQQIMSALVGEGGPQEANKQAAFVLSNLLNVYADPTSEDSQNFVRHQLAYMEQAGISLADQEGAATDLSGAEDTSPEFVELQRRYDELEGMVRQMQQTTVEQQREAAQQAEVQQATQEFKKELGQLKEDPRYKDFTDDDIEMALDRWERDDQGELSLARHFEAQRKYRLKLLSSHTKSKVKQADNAPVSAGRSQAASETPQAPQTFEEARQAFLASIDG